jgi:hypothetical protein
MNRRKSLTVGFGLAFYLATGSAFAEGQTQKCGGADIANGPFAYSTPSVTQTTFNGMGGSPVPTSFTITAPSVNGQNDANVIDVFPGEGNDQDCSSRAYAAIGVLEISKVGDANGNPLLTPEPLDPFSGVGHIIAGAFSLTPTSYLFGIGEQITVNVSISNPDLSPVYYGDYDIKLAAQAPGSGIGVGNGPHFFLSLRGPSATDTTPPVLSVTKPGADEILGVIGVEITAMDPTGPVASGLASINATVSSAKGTVSGLPIALVFNPSLPQPAGVVVTATGSFTPTGGAPGSTAGTKDGPPFTPALRSGIGSYTINARASDVAGNVGEGSKTFNVKYDVAFTDQSVPGGCSAISKPGSCTGRFQFTVRRSDETSDGEFMVDQTVLVQLVTNNSVVAQHVFGTTAIHEVVQIDSENEVYQTHFKRGDLPGSPSYAAYRVQVYFQAVDGEWMLHATSDALSF